MLYRTERDDVTLTTHRLRRSDDSECTSMMLEEVCSVQVVRTDHRILLAVMLLFFIGAGYFASSTAPSNTPVAIPVLLASAGAVSLLAYFFTRFSEVVVASAGSQIRFRLLRKGIEHASEFVFALESAKNQRYMLITGDRPVGSANQVVAIDLGPDKLEGRKVRTVDAGLSVYQAPDLGVTFVPLPAGTEIELGSMSEPDGRQWFGVILPNGDRGYVLAASIRSHTR